MTTQLKHCAVAIARAACVPPTAAQLLYSAAATACRLRAATCGATAPLAAAPLAAQLPGLFRRGCDGTPLAQRGVNNI